MGFPKGGDYMSISENIKRIREDYHLTQEELGKLAGVTDKAVSKWESGLAEPRMGAVQKISVALGISKSRIVEDYDNYVSEKEALINKAFGDRPEMRTLFSLAENASKEDIEKAIQIFEMLKK